MKDTELYYTPELWEFHENFEYEYSYNGNEFIKTTFSIGTGDIDEGAGDWYEFSPNNPKTVCRVKFLDKSDIENLGWEYDVNESGEEQPDMFEKHGYSSAYCIDRQDTPSKTTYLIYHFPDGFLIIDSIVNCGSGREEMLFRGNVKNKSQLSTLMQQIDIKTV